MPPEALTFTPPAPHAPMGSAVLPAPPPAAAAMHRGGGSRAARAGPSRSALIAGGDMRGGQRAQRAAGARAWPQTRRCRPRSATAGGPRSRRCAARPAPRPAAPSCRARPRAGRRRCGARPQTRARSSAPAGARARRSRPATCAARAGRSGEEPAQGRLSLRRHAGQHSLPTAPRGLCAARAGRPAGSWQLAAQRSHGANAEGRPPLQASLPRACHEGCHEFLKTVHKLSTRALYAPRRTAPLSPPLACTEERVCMSVLCDPHAAQSVASTARASEQRAQLWAPSRAQRAPGRARRACAPGSAGCARPAARTSHPGRTCAAGAPGPPGWCRTRSAARPPTAPLRGSPPHAVRRPQQRQQRLPTQ